MPSVAPVMHHHGARKVLISIDAASCVCRWHPHPAVGVAAAMSPSLAQCIVPGASASYMRCCHRCHPSHARCRNWCSMPACDSHPHAPPSHSPSHLPPFCLLQRCFGEEGAKNLYISSTKGATGHALGAAGGLEAIACCMAIQVGVHDGSEVCLRPA